MARATAPEEVEGEAREVGLTVIEPHEIERLDETATPEGMVALAARMATALADIVEKKGLFAVIQGKKYPQVEAWMTIGRMDNVAAREVRGGITRVEGGGFEAEVELIRLSDGMNVGYGSAMCGTPGDSLWDKRPIHVQRSMAVTRATSRAFRQRYSWIMALAGYEPTPADEMPGAVSGATEPRPELVRRAEGLQGVANLGKDGGTTTGTDYLLREEKTRGHVLGFRLTQGRKGYKVLAFDPLASVLARENIIGEDVTCWGTMQSESFTGKDNREVTYQILHLERIATADFILPAEESAPPPTGAEREELDALPW